VDAAHTAKSCAELFRDNEAYRGCPPTAKMVMQATLEGIAPELTGLPPYFAFPGGSFANGGAMRISPLAIAYRKAPAGKLRTAVETAVLSSHRHPEAVDFAVVQAAAVQYALNATVDSFDPAQLLPDLIQRCEVPDMRKVISEVANALKRCAEVDQDLPVLESILADVERPRSGMGFQIASVHMAPCVLWVACRYFEEPRTAVKQAIDIGGDTDTCASMVGAIMGALHGEQWCADWAEQMENGPHGRDFATTLAAKLLELDIKT